jgi:GT2 family glycosyltransferase
MSASEPLVRVVVLNYNGGDLTIDCLRSLLETDWPPERLEVVLVDNASTDGVVDRVRRELPHVVVVPSPVNGGFSAGCNLGIRTPGAYDLLALINNDATVEPGWLRPLAAAIDTSRRVGAACPKMLIAGRFLEARVDAPGARPVDGRTLGVEVTAALVDGERRDDQLSFDEGFFPPEPSSTAATDGLARWSWRTGAVRVRVPDGGPLPGRLALRLRPPAGGAAVTVCTDVDACAVDVGAEGTWVEVALGGAPFDVINSAGASLYAAGFAGDRGFLERDRGQYDAAAEVFAFSGGAVVLSRQLLTDIGLFDERLFLYYEDTDLAWRGRLRGWRYAYEPSAVVRHRHAASTVVGSPLFRYHTERNRPLVLAKNAPAWLAARAGLGVLSRAARASAGALRRADPATRQGAAHQRRVAAGYLRLLPSMLAARWSGRRSVPRRDVLRWVETKEAAR